MKESIKNATIVDVRSSEEYKAEHFPRAINIPLDQVQQRINEFQMMPRPIVTYCRSGARSGMAVSILKQGGISETINAGGLDDLKQKMRG